MIKMFDLRLEWFVKVFLLSVTVLIAVCDTVLSSDDYDYIQRVELERKTREQSPDTPLDGLYSIESAKNGLFLTAKNGRGSLGSTVMMKWTESGSQLWAVTKFDTSRGYSLKPLTNEYNTVTSTLKNNAHAYNAWEFKKQGNSNTFIIFNTLNKRCLQTASFKEAVQFEKCLPTSTLQHWRINKIE